MKASWSTGLAPELSEVRVHGNGAQMVVMALDGAMFVADPAAGRIYRIRYYSP